MNKIITIREYEQMIKNCNSKNIIEEDINCFEKDIVAIQLLIKRAKKEL